MPMNPAYKAPWIAALRSGDYRQTQYKLYDGDGYCCLGVLCKVAGSEFYSTEGDCAQVFMPTRVEGHLLADDHGGGLNQEGEALFGLHGKLHTLIDMNDGREAGTIYNQATGEHVPMPQVARKSFAEIADWIEANL